MLAHRFGEHSLQMLVVVVGIVVAFVAAVDECCQLVDNCKILKCFSFGKRAAGRQLQIPWNFV